MNKIKIIEKENTGLMSLANHMESLSTEELAQLRGGAICICRKKHNGCIRIGCIIRIGCNGRTVVVAPEDEIASQSIEFEEVLY